MSTAPAEPVGVFRPESLRQALTMLSGSAGQPQNRIPATLLAGGTDLYPARIGRPLGERVVDLSGLAELSGVTTTRSDGKPMIRIGAMTRWADLRDRRFAALHGAPFDALSIAAGGIGGRQIQSRATIAGNLCHASPAADGIPVLLALDARVLLRDANGARELPLAQFITGPRRTALQAGELLEAILVPDETAASHSSHSAFLKLGHRRYLVISAAMIAVSLGWAGTTNPTLSSCRIAVGACGPIATRLTQLEQSLQGTTASGIKRLLAGPLESSMLAPLSPITDVRATAGYRIEAVDLMTRRALVAMADRPGESMQDVFGSGLSAT